MGSERKLERSVEQREGAGASGEMAALGTSGPATETICEMCGGAGELAYFRGRSRFLLSRKECPGCGGDGRVLRPDAPRGQGAEGEADF